MWSKDHVVLSFLAPGAPKDTLSMRLEVVARLPEGSWAWLEAPLWLIDAMGERSPFVVVDDSREVGRLPVNPHGGRLLGTGMFPAGSRAQLRLLVHVPRAYRRRPHDVYVRQIWEGQEVGRVTWRLGGAHEPSPTQSHRAKSKRARPA